MPTSQQPLGSGFTAWSTADDVIRGVDLSGRTAIVTGGYSHLGLETARVLANAGAQVIIPARSPDRARDMITAVKGAELETLDLMDPASIDAFADRFLASGRALNIMVNSAGIMATPIVRDKRGHESQFSTNHLGHFQLVCRLWPALVRAEGARVVSISSRAHQIAGVDFTDLDFERRVYDKWVAYGQSKTANVLFALALDKRGEAQSVRAFSLHPGSILGPLARHLTREEIDSFGAIWADGTAVIDPDRDMKTLSQGAATSVWCATSSQLDGLGGVYCENSDVARIMPHGSPQRSGVVDRAIDPVTAEQLWVKSEAMTGTSLSQSPT